MSKDYLSMQPEDFETTEDYARADFAMRKQAHEAYIKTLEVQQEASKEQVKALNKLVKTFARIMDVHGKAIEGEK